MPNPKIKSLSEYMHACLAWQVYHLPGDPYEQISNLVRFGKTGSLTIHFHHGRPNGLEWREPAPKLDHYQNK